MITRGGIFSGAGSVGREMGGRHADTGSVTRVFSCEMMPSSSTWEEWILGGEDRRFV